jgi:hypothetical protein
MKHCVYPFFLTELFFFDLFTFTTYFYMYVSPQRRTTPCNAYKKHENEKIIRCFDPKNGCFAIHVPTQLLNYERILNLIGHFHRLHWSGGC